MLTMLICDDSGKQIVLLKKAIMEYQDRKGQELFRIHTTFTSADAIKFVHENELDIAILDIEIDNKTGIDIAKEILKYNKKCKIMFNTNYDSFAYSAFEINAFSYLLKPFEVKKLWKQLDRMLVECQKENLLKRYGGAKLEFKFRGITTTVSQEEILYIEKKGKSVVVVTDETEYEYIDNLKDLEKKLDHEFFLRCHNGFIINLRRISSFCRTEVYLGDNAICIPVSKANIPKMNRIMEDRIWENAIC